MRVILAIILMMPIFCFGQDNGVTYKVGATNQANIQKGGVGGDSLNAVPYMSKERAKSYLTQGTGAARRQGRMVVDTSDKTLYYHDDTGFVALATRNYVNAQIANIPTVDLSGIRDTTAAIYDSLADIRDAIDNIPTPTIPTWQQTLNQGRTGDSVLISDNLFIGTNSNKKPVVLELWEDSRGVPAYVDTRYGWAQIVTNILGWKLDNKSGSGCMFMSQTPLNPNGCAPNFIDALPTIRNVSAITDTTFITVSARGFNDAAAFNNSGFTNYSPTNFGISYRLALDSLIAKGRNSNGNRIIVCTPAWIPRLGFSGEIAAIKQFGDTAKAIATQYGLPYFDAFAWMRDHSTALDFLPDSVHERLSGYGVRAEGFLNFIKYEVIRDTQHLAVNGQAEFNDIKFRLSADTSDGRPNVVGVNSKGDGVILTDVFPRLYDGITDTGDGGNLNLAGFVNARDARLRNLVTYGTGISVTDGLALLRSYTTGIGTIWSRNGFSTFSNVSTGTAGRSYVNASGGGVTVNSGSDDNTGMDVQLRNTVSLYGMALMSGAPTYAGTLGWHSQIWTSPTFGLVINVRNNSTSTAGDMLLQQTGVGNRVKIGYLNYPNGTSSKAAIQGGLFVSDTTNINNNLYITPTGVFNRYRGGTAALNRIIIGNGTIYDTATVTAGTGISITNSSGRLTFSTDTTTVSSNLWFIDTTAITTTSSRTTTRAFNQFYVDATSGNVTLTFTSSARQTIHVTRRDATANVVTIQFTGKNVQGNPSFTGLTTSNQNAPFFDNGTNRIEIQ